MNLNLTKDKKDQNNNCLETNNHLIDTNCNNRNLELLIASETRYRRLFEAAKDGVLILDAETGMIMDVNPFLMELLSYTKDQLIQKAIWDIGAFHDIVANKEKFLELQNNEYVRYDDLPLRTSLDKTIYVEFVSNVYLVNDSKVIQCNIRDISQRKLSDNLLLFTKAKADESERLKAAFLQNISHEIRTPLNAILGFSALLSNAKLSVEEREQYVDKIESSGDLLAKIITDFINIATLETGQEKIIENEIDIKKMMLQMHEHFLLKAKVQKNCLKLVPFLYNEPYRLYSDEGKIKQILNCLIDNALKFTKHGHISYGVELKNEEYEFHVKDTGIGISEEMHEDIFKRFRQVERSLMREYGGSGLGLSISKAYVELLGGKIWLKSEPNTGSTFYFTIPKITSSKL